jgi:hypothetical protein
MTSKFPNVFENMRISLWRGNDECAMLKFPNVFHSDKKIVSLFILIF